MAIKLYDVVPSSNCDRVKIVLYEKGLSCEIVRLDEKKMDQKKPEHLKLNPYGKVPVIDDDGRILFESCIINGEGVRHALLSYFFSLRNWNLRVESAFGFYEISTIRKGINRN